jgi:single-stranded DNA-specific DHH superfamily exonuclease
MNQAYDVFNGDADGICALLQLRLQQPLAATLVTGVKRDIALLERVPLEAAAVAVLDVSLDKNRAPLERLLEAGAEVFYCDHHFAGDIPEHPGLRARINTAPEVCTSLLINGELKGAYAAWAVVGAFGDNLNRSAEALARQIDVDADLLARYRDLGTYINYNGYGPSLDELHFHPAELYELMLPHRRPEDFIHESAVYFQRLEEGYHDDMAAAESLSPVWRGAGARLFILPDAAWARRVSGVYGNALANAAPESAHAVLTRKRDGGFLVSVRAPLRDRRDADVLCRAFPGGGGRAAAAGINDLPEDELDRFTEALANTYPG